MCAVVPHHLGKGHPLRVPRCIPSGHPALPRPVTRPAEYHGIQPPSFRVGQCRKQRVAVASPVRQERSCSPDTPMTGETSLSPGPHDEGAFALPSTPSTKGPPAPLWTPTANRPPVGWRQVFRALNHEQGLELASSTCTEPWPNVPPANRHLRRSRRILEWIFPATQAKLIGYREQRMYGWPWQVTH